MTEVLATLKANWELIAFFGGLLLSGYRLFKRASKRMLHQTVLEQIKPAQEEMLAAMAAMSEQFKNNGGSSMRDAVDGVSKKLDYIGPQLLALRANTQMPYLEMDCALRHTFVNAAFRDLFGVRFDDALGLMEWQSFVHPDDRDRLAQERRRLIEHPSDYIIPARIVNRRDGKMFYTTSYGFLVVVGGEFVGYCATTSIERVEEIPPELMNVAPLSTTEAHP